MTLRTRLIGGAVDGLMLAIDTIASFWQTPREVEWAKAAADGLAEREDGLGPILDNFIDEPVFTPAVESAFRSGGQTFQTGPRPKLSTSHAALCACGHWLHPGGACAACGCTNVRLPKTSAPTPGAVDGPAEGEPPEPSAGVDDPRPPCVYCLGLNKADLFVPLGDTYEGMCLGCAELNEVCVIPPAPSAEVEPPASAPSAESPAPEFDWVTTAIPVIAGVLAEHEPVQRGRYFTCYSSGELMEPHAEFDNWQDWRNHVSPCIAAALQTPRAATVYDFPSGDRPRPLADYPKHQ